MSSQAIVYDDLSDDAKVLIEDVRVLIGDQMDDDGKVFLSDDEWAVVLQNVINSWNGTRPRTNYDANGAPIASFYDVFYAGMMYFGAMTIANQFRRNLPVQNMEGPYVDVGQYVQMWTSLAAEVKEEWTKAKNRSKMAFLPKGRGSVDRNSFAGRSAAVVPILRALPSWQFAR